MDKCGRVFLFPVLLLVAGCSHALEIRNLSDYQSGVVQTLPRSVSIGIESSNTRRNGGMLVEGAAEALSKYAQVLYPYTQASGRDVNFLMNIAVKPRHKGSGANFWINWPGFLIWTPAWNGYVYKPAYDIDIALTSTGNGQVVDTFSLPIDLDVRQADIGRTWTEISWLEVSVIALIGGAAFTQYDPDITTMVEVESKATIGEHVARAVIARIANSNALLELTAR